MSDWDIQISAALRKSVPGSDESEELPLIFHREKPTIDRFISGQTIVSVYDDVSYAVEFASEEFLDSFDLFDISIESQSVYKGRADTARHYFKQRANFSTEYKKIFSNSLGLVYLELTLRRDDSEETLRLYSDYFSVCLARGVESENLYGIYEKVRKYSALLYSENVTLLSRSADSDDESELIKIFDRYLLTLKKIISVYSYNAVFFSSNSRARLEMNGSIDNFEKLTEVKPETLFFIANHPDELEPTHEKNDIQIGSFFYLPRKTLVFKNKLNFDVYENRVVVSFLEDVILKTKGAADNLGQFFEGLPLLSLSDEFYINTSSIVLEEYKGLYNEISQKLLEALKEIKKIHFQYSRFLPVTRLKGGFTPKPTPVFLNIPQYRQIYAVMREWYGNRLNSGSAQFVMSTVSESSKLYEHYLLIKIIEELTRLGWSMTEKKFENWLQLQKNTGNPPCNYFEFVRGEKTLQLFFEPVISCSREENVLTGLFRNSTAYISSSSACPLTLRSNAKEEAFYTPDYVLKLNDEGKSYYLILDAKFSNLASVISAQLLPLIFKYILGITPINASDRIEGLLLVCGKYTKEYERSRRHPLWNVGAGAFEIFSAEKINVVEVNEAYAPNGLTEMLSKFLCRFETS